MTSEIDEYYMRVALNHARRGIGHVMPNPSVGCVIVQRGRIVGIGRTAHGGRPHAEAEALQMAGMLAKGADVYVTLEPCSGWGRAGPCADALVNAAVRRVVVACIDPNPVINGRGLEIMRQAGIDVEIGLLEEEALSMNAGFISRIGRKRPYVTGKLAVSSDGKIAAVKGTRSSLSGPLAAKYTHALRSYNDAILTGIGTVLVDNPHLTTRIKGHSHSITRIVLDEKLEIPLNSELVQSAHDDPLWIVCSQSGVDNNEDKSVELRRMGCELIVENPHDLDSVLTNLAERGLTRILVEGGAKVLSAFLEAAFVDEFVLIRTPHTLGPDGVDALNGHDVFLLEQDFEFKKDQIRNLGEDLVEIYRRKA